MAYLRAYQALSGDPGFFRSRGVSIPKFGQMGRRRRGFRDFGRSAMLGIRAGAPIVSVMPGMGPISLAAGLVGDPGLGSLLGRLAGGAGRILGRVASSPVGRAAGALITGGGALGALGGLAAGAAIPAAVGLAQRAFGGHGGRKYRRMDVGNVKALRRSMRRVEGFAKLAKSTIAFTHQTRMRKRGRKR